MRLRFFSRGRLFLVTESEVAPQRQDRFDRTVSLATLSRLATYLSSLDISRHGRNLQDLFDAMR